MGKLKVEVRVPSELWSRRASWRGRVVAVHVEPGRRVRVGDPLVEVEVEKAVLVIESPYEGVVLEVPVSMGDTIGPGDVVAVIEVGGS